MSGTPVSDALCAVTGHKPAEARRLNCLGWYATLGMLMSVVALGTAGSTYSLMRTQLHEGRSLAVLAASFVGLMVFGIERMLVQMPLLSDGFGPRAKFLLIRGVPSVLLSAYMAWGLVMSGFHDSLQAIATKTAATHAKNDGNSIGTNPHIQGQIEADNTQIGKLVSQDSTLEGRSAANWAAWHEDMVVCAKPGRYQRAGLTCHGDVPGPGNISNPLKAIASNYDKTVLKPTEAANAVQLKTLRAEVASLTAKAAAPGDVARSADLADTGLAAQTGALWTLLDEDPFLWLLPLTLMGLDMSVALAKAFGPVTGFDRKARDEVWAARRQAGSRDADPAWQAAFARVNVSDAGAYAVEQEADATERTRAATKRAAKAANGSSGTGWGRRVRPALAVTSVLAVVLAVVGFAETGDGARKPAEAVPAVTASAAPSLAPVVTAKPITVAVSPTAPVRVTVPGVGTLTAAKGSFSKAGTMTVTAAKATPPSASGVVPFGSGVDVAFHGTKLTRPVNLSFPLRHTPGIGAPIVAHRADDGTWNYLPVSMSNNTVTVATQKFSLNLLGWVKDLKQWAGDAIGWVGDRLASAIGGRTSPLSCAGAPGWFHYSTGHSDLVHVCAKDAGLDGGGVDRAEIQIKSNRGVTIQVTVPGSPQYVVVQDQSWNERRWLLPKLGLDPNQTVLLPAGETMWVGYTRPAANVSYSFTVDGATPLAFGDTMLRQALGMLMGEFPQTWLLYTEGACTTDFAVGLSGFSTGTSFGDLLRCLSTQVLSNLEDPGSADNIAAALGDAGAGDGLVAAAKRIPDVAMIVALVPVFQEGWGNDIDVIKGLVTGGRANQVDFSMDGPPAPASVPPTSAAPSPSDSSTTTSGGGTGPGRRQGGSGSGGSGSGGTGSSIGGSGSGGTGSGSGGAGSGSGGAGSGTGGPGSSVPGSSSVPPAPATHDFYSNWGATTNGIPMCRGNLQRPESLPGGTVTETFNADATGTIDTAKVQIDPDPTVTAHATLTVNGNSVNDDQIATGDVTFDFGSVAVDTGDTVSLVITFTASYGKVITVYQVGQPGGTLSVSNTCTNPGMPNSTTSAGLRAVVSGTV